MPEFFNICYTTSNNMKKINVEQGVLHSFGQCSYYLDYRTKELNFCHLKNIKMTVFIFSDLKIQVLKSAILFFSYKL